ncbi:MAG TPA: DNA-binding protein [Actinomycetota bacterium]|nr:DNA-binding protein [Actinomycetota bacterium]
MAFFSKMVEKLARPPEEVRAENVRDWASALEGTVPIAGLAARQRCKVAGVVQNIRIDPRPGRDSMEVTITDGTGTMIAKWLGRQGMAGVQLGIGLVVEGIVGEQGRDRMILNPEYQLLPGPEAG